MTCICSQVWQIPLLSPLPCLWVNLKVNRSVPGLKCDRLPPDCPASASLSLSSRAADPASNPGANSAGPPPFEAKSESMDQQLIHLHWLNWDEICFALQRVFTFSDQVHLDAMTRKQNMTSSSRTSPRLLGRGSASYMGRKSLWLWESHQVSVNV